MARDGSRAYERAENDLARLVKRAKDRARVQADQKARPNQGALMPKPPPMAYAQSDALHRFTPISHAANLPSISLDDIALTPYETALLAAFRVADFASMLDDSLPRLLCRKTGATIGFVAPVQWRTMQGIWPDLTIEQAEAMLATTGAIAPQALFSHPAALQALLAFDPAGAAILTLELSLGASWAALDKARRKRHFEAQIKEDGCEELAVIAFELALDCMRMHKDWIALDCVKKRVPALVISSDIGEIVELLKECGSSVAQWCISTKQGLFGISPEKRLELFSRHGASIARKSAPVIGEQSLIRRAIALYCRDYAYLLQRLSDDELFAIIGNAHQFSERAIKAYSMGKHLAHSGLDKAMRAAKAAEQRADFEKLMFEGFVNIPLDDDGQTMAEKRMQQMQAEKEAQRSKMEALRMRLNQRKQATNDDNKNE